MVNGNQPYNPLLGKPTTKTSKQRQPSRIGEGTNGPLSRYCLVGEKIWRLINKTTKQPETGETMFNPYAITPIIDADWDEIFPQSLQLVQQSEEPDEQDYQFRRLARWHDRYISE